jgi:hypothetical protein
MRSVPHGPNPPDMRGKKSMRCRCPCCTWQDFREDYWRKLADREMRDFKRSRNR